MTPNEYPTRLDICDGKYTLIIDTDTGRAECLRYGEKWRDLVGDKMVLALFDELVEARVREEAAKAEAEFLRAKIEQMEQQEPVRWGCTVLQVDGSWKEEIGIEEPPKDYFSIRNAFPLYALPGAQPAPSVPSEEAAAEMGANGGHVVEAERLAFEAWMRGHCWKLGAKWTGTEYRSAFEKGGMVDTHAMRTRELWAAWRDRAALAAPKPEAKP